MMFALNEINGKLFNTAYVTAKKQMNQKWKCLTCYRIILLKCGCGNTR